MKRLFIYTLIVLLGFFTKSCQDLDELNENPNNVSETHPQLLLTEISAEAFQVTGTSPLYASRMLIQTGEENDYQYFKWGNGSFGEFNDLRQVTKMIEEATRIESPNYIAIGKFFRAYYFYQLSLRFGDIPYSEALMGESSDTFQPAYDSQEAVFEGIITELDEAASMIEEDVAIDGDIIFYGDAKKWLKLINSYELKILLSLSNKTTAGSINIASKFKEVYTRGVIINSLDDNAQLVFQDQQDSRYSEFNSSSYGSSMYMSATYIDLLQQLKDPRLFIVAEQTSSASSKGLAINDFDSYNGGSPIENYSVINETLVANGNISKVNARYYTNPTTEPHNILSYWEVEFIIAEASVRGWISDQAATHFENAVRANFNFYRSNASDYSEYLSEDIVEAYLDQSLLNLNGTEEEKLKTILTQKYITTFLQAGWSQYYDYLRTGYPEFAYPTGQTPPYRFVYPVEEYNNNTANLEAAIKSQFGGNDGIRQLPWWLN
ncbi:SusD/RagB family nutrient-binding outer membrane lipoprotein [Zunongwangia pacifica]|uniref:SusD/RagB family nutrient-binding outer membrane lipoprotein n=1 Tax=Zunongwangia pacifica TaxID=2911062 RepID=A0A9X2CR28_9FLAO|nr:SusD/RagB family nutrient-binding outer membrane lipoprotein [Zunongwangia pacifica]MCL6220788.1 SusD/RagB family nutrient-binding outer membrane lipoprotein [Zunongwangia pacifica]